MPDTRGTAGLLKVELKLAESLPFGSYDYISANLSIVYTKLLGFLANHFDVARDFLNRLNVICEVSRVAVFRDSLVRRTLEDGVCRIARGIDAIDSEMLSELLSAAAENAVTGKRTLLNECGRCIPLSQTASYGYVWADDRCETLPVQRFNQEILKRLPGFHIAMPTSDEISALVSGCTLAERTAPSLVKSAMSHNFMVVVGELESADKFSSLTMPGMPGVMFLSPKAVSTAAEAAQALVHESFHLKFLDIDYVHPLFALGFTPETTPRITPVWHNDRPENGNWPIDRLLTSMHVYLALAVFLERASKRDGVDHLFGREACAARSTQCRMRAAWLFDNVQDYTQFLSSEGKDFVASMGAMLTEMDSESGAAGRVR